MPITCDGHLIPTWWLTGTNIPTKQLNVLARDQAIQLSNDSWSIGPVTRDKTVNG